MGEEQRLPRAVSNDKRAKMATDQFWFWVWFWAHQNPIPTHNVT